MLHCLAYGNSDQASFRDLDVRNCLDVLIVPSTIASYYPDATAAFVLSSGLDYLIEPRTPLFQAFLESPRASHYTLADAMGSAVSDHFGSPDVRESGTGVNFTADFYSVEVCDEVVESMIDFQRAYGGRAEAVEAKLDCYKRLLRLANGDAGPSSDTDQARSPRFMLCPYFAVRSLYDEWWDVMGRVWSAASRLDCALEISPVVAITDVFELGEAIDNVPSGLSSRLFFWIPGFDERRVAVSHLRELKRVVSQTSLQQKLMNLYGGYFSIILGRFGLAGFNNGLGYSESRNWPTLESTGAAPARYYVRKLHAYLPTATATALVEADGAFLCECTACYQGMKLPNKLSYHELKRHFALARAWELKESRESELSDLCEAMRDDADRFKKVKRRLPSDLRIPVEHLTRWAQALDA